MPKTEAELKAEADAAAKARADEAAKAKKAEEESRAAGVLDYIKSWLPDISFFNILVFGLLAFGAYAFGKSKTGAELLEKGIALLPESWQPTAAGLFNKIGIPIDVGAPLTQLADKDIGKLRETLTSGGVDAPIVAAITKTPATFKGLLQTISSTTGGKVSLADLSPEAIVKGPALDALLKPENRANTAALMHAAAPAISEKTLTALIDHNMAGGKPSASLRALFTAATDKSLETLQGQLMDAKGKFSPVKAIDMLLNAKNRALIRSFGTDNIAIVMAEKAPMLDKKTLDAALKFGDEIDKNPANNGPNRPRTLAVLHAVANVAQGTPPAKAFQGITGDQLAGFFSASGNIAAVGNVVQTVQPAMAKYWGNADHGLAEVLASKPDAINILKYINDGTKWYEDLAGKVASAAGMTLERKLYWAGGNKISENSADMAIVVPLLAPTKPAPARGS